MRLLVSVRDAGEARAALAGSAAIVDAKEPARGALGAVELAVLREIGAVVDGVCPLSAALGDASDAAVVERAAREAAWTGAAYVKVGFSGVGDPARAVTLLRAAVRGVRAASETAAGGETGAERAAATVVAVAYADADRVASVTPPRIIDIAAEAGAGGVLLDTARKDRGALFALMPPREVGAWVDAAHAASLAAAVAGKLTASDLPTVRALGADIAGVRGAACVGGREGRVSTDRVRRLVAAAAGARAGGAMDRLVPGPPPRDPGVVR